MIANKTVTFLNWLVYISVDKFKEVYNGLG